MGLVEREKREREKEGKGLEGERDDEGMSECLNHHEV